MRTLLAVAVFIAIAMPATARAQCVGVDPEAFNAVPSDGKDDQAGLQAAWDAACSLQQPLCLAAGRYDVTRRQAAGAANIGSLKLTCAGAGVATSCTDIAGDPLVGIEVAGAGMAKTVVSLMGDGTFPGSSGPSSWSLFQPQNIDGLCFRDMTLAGDRRGDTSDQTHLFEVLGPADNVVVERVETWLPQFDDDPTNDRGGDCMRSVGTDIDDVVGFVIRDSVIGPCYRVGVIWQRGTHDALLEDSWVKAERNKQAMDLESSSGGQLYNITIRRTQFTRDAGQTGPTIGLDGVGVAEAITDTLWEDVTIEQGGVVIDDVLRMTFRRVKIDTGGSQTPGLQILKHVVDLLFEDTTVLKTGDGEVVKIYEQENRIPTNVRFLRGLLRTTGIAFIVYGEGVLNLELDGTTIEYAGGAVAAPMIKLRGLTNAGDPDTTVLKNVIAVPGAMDGILEWVISSGGTGGTATVKGLRAFGVATSFPLFTVTGSAGTPTLADNYIKP